MTTSPSASTVSITDDDAAGVTVSESVLEIVEGASGSYTVVLDTEPSGVVTVTVGGVGGTDVSVSPAALTFTADDWDTAQEVTLTAGGDDDAVDEALVTVSHEVSGYGTVTTAADVTVTVIDDDTAGVTIIAVELAVLWGGSNTYDVVLDSEPSGDVTVSVKVPGGTDVSVSPAILTFTTDDWGTAQRVTVTADVGAAFGSVALGHVVSGGGYGDVEAGDVMVEVVSVSEGVNGQLGVTTQENLAVPEGGDSSYTVVLSSLPISDVTVAIGLPEGTDLSITPVGAELVFTTENWSVPQTVTVEAAEDDDAIVDVVTIGHTASGGVYDDVSGFSVEVTVIENDTVGVSVSPVSLTIDEGASGSYTVVLDTQPSGDVTVAVDAAANTDVTADPASLTFTADDWGTAQTVTVTAGEDDDAADEADATITHTVSGADYGMVTAADVTVSITDDDDPAVTVSFGSAVYSVAEGATVTVTVLLSADPQRTVTVPLNAANQAGVSAVDYSGVPADVVFASGETEKSFAFTAVDDEVDDDGESVLLGFGTSLPDRVTAASPSTSTVSIVDDDTAGVAVSPSSLRISEGNAGSYTVVLHTQPTGDVTVTVGGVGGTDVSVSPAALTFTADDWDAAQTVTVTAGEDDDAVDEALATITHTVSGADYGSMTAADVTVTVVDDDTAGVTVSPSSLRISEGNAGSYTVVLHTQPAGVVTVTVGGVGGSDVSVSPTALTFTADDWDAAQTVVVSAGEDDEAVNDSATITHVVSGYGSVTSASSVTVSIVDDDTAGVTVSESSLDDYRGWFGDVYGGVAHTTGWRCDCHCWWCRRR